MKIEIDGKLHTLDVAGAKKNGLLVEVAKYVVGDCFTHRDHNGLYLLCYDRREREMYLVNVKSGLMWNGVKVKTEVTEEANQEEFEKITNGYSSQFVKIISPTFSAIKRIPKRLGTYYLYNSEIHLLMKDRSQFISLVNLSTGVVYNSIVATNKEYFDDNFHVTPFGWECLTYSAVNKFEQVDNFSYHINDN